MHRKDIDENGVIDMIEWFESLQPNEPELRPFFMRSDTGSMRAGEGSLLPTLSETECKQMDAMVKRLDKLAQLAAARKVLHVPLSFPFNLILSL
jgi:hypothetical protein